VDQSPSESLTNNFQQQSADNRASYVISRGNQYSRAPLGYSGRHDYATLSQINRQNYAVLARNTYTPMPNRSFKEVTAKENSIKYLSAFTGLDEHYVRQNYDSVIQQAYPDSAPSPAKINENFKSILINAQMIQDLDSWYRLRALGNTSSHVNHEIEVRERNLKNTDEWIRLMPQGTIRRELEEAYYSVAEQYPQMRDTITAGIKGSISGAAVVAAAGVITYLSGGAAAPLTATMLTEGTATIGGSLGLGVKAGSAISMYDTQRDMMIGSNFRNITNRLTEEGLKVDPRSVAQISKIIGSISSALEVVGEELFLGMIGPSKTLKKAFYQTLSSQGMADQIINIAASRLGKMGVVVGQENLTEVAQEIVEYIATETYMKSQGSEDAWDMSMDQFTDTLWTLVRDTTANTLVYGSLANAIGLAQDIRATSAQISDIKKLTKEQRSIIANLPNDYEQTVVTNGNNVQVNLSDEQINLDGEQIHTAIVDDPAILNIISPAQQTILDRYIRANPEAVRLTEALALLTGKTDAQLRGLSDLSSINTPIKDKAITRFAERANEGNPKIDLDGGLTEVSDPRLAVRVTVGDDVTISVNDKQNIHDAGEIKFEIAPSGGLSIKSVGGTLERSTLSKVLDEIFPSNVMFDNPDFQGSQELDAMSAYTRADVPSTTVEDADAILKMADELESKVEDSRTPDDKTTVVKKVPVVKYKYEEYWENEYYPEPIVEGEVIEEEAVQPESKTEVNPEEKGAEQKQTVLRKYEKTIAKAESFIAEAIESNKNRAPNTTPIDVARYQRSLKRVKEAYELYKSTLEIGSHENAKRTIEINRIEGIESSIEEVWEAHKGSKQFLNLSELDRKRKIVSLYREDLSEDARQYFNDDYSSGKFALLQNIKDELVNKKETDHDVSDTVTPSERAEGMVDLSDFEAMTKEAEEDNSQKNRDALNKELTSLKRERSKTKDPKKRKSLKDEIDRVKKELEVDDGAVPLFDRMEKIQHKLTILKNKLNRIRTEKALLGARVQYLHEFQKMVSDAKKTKAVPPKHNKQTATIVTIIVDKEKRAIARKRLTRIYEDMSSIAKKYAGAVKYSSLITDYHFFNEHFKELSTETQAYFGNKVRPGNLVELEAIIKLFAELKEDDYSNKDTAVSHQKPGSKIVVGVKNLKKRTKKVKKIPYTTFEERRFENIEHPKDYSDYKRASQIIKEAKAKAQDIKDTVDEMISLIRTMSMNVETPELRAKIRDLALQYNYSLYTDAEIRTGTMPDGEGITPQEADRRIEAAKGKLESLPIAQLKEVYDTVLSIARTDMKLSGYKIGNIEMGYTHIMRGILKELTEGGDSRKSRKERGRIHKMMAAIYDNTINYDLLIEKIHGKKTLLYKLLYQNIKDSSLKKARFDMEFTKKYGELLSHIPGVEDANKFYGEVMFSQGRFDITRDLVLSLWQHKRSGINGYNWRMIRNNGISFSGRFDSKRLSVEAEQALLDFVDSYNPTSQELQAIDHFQQAMNELYDMANTRHMEIFGTALPKSEFYMRLRPDPSFELDRHPSPMDAKDDVSFAFAPANVKERLGTNKPILITGIGQELVDTTHNISGFFYMYKDFSVAQNIVNNSAFKQLLTKHYHDSYHDYIVYGLQRWSGNQPPVDVIGKVFDYTRRSFVTAVLTLNPEVAIKQVLSFPFFGVYVDSSYLLNAVFDTMKDGARIDKILKAWSTEYATRGLSAGNVDINDTIVEGEGKRLLVGSKKFEGAKWGLIRKADNVTVRAGMWAAMQQFLAEVEQNHFSNTIKDALDIDDSIIPDLNETSKMQLAAKFAEYVLERTQPTQSPEHVSTFQRKTALTRSFSAFGSYTNNINNLMNRTFNAMKRGDPNSVKAFVVTMILASIIVPATTSAFDAERRLLWKAVKDDEPPEQEVFWSLFGEAFFGNSTGYWFVIRDAAKMFQQMIERGAGADSGTEDVMFEEAKYLGLAAGQLFKAIWPSYSKEVRAKALENGLQNLAKGSFYITGLPYYPIKVATALYERSKN